MKFPVLPFVFMIPTSLLAAEFDGLQFYVMSQATSETYVMERAFSSNGVPNKNLFEIVNTNMSQFKYGQRSNDFRTLACNSVISSPPTVTYRRTREITKELKKSIAYFRKNIAPIEIEAYYSCHTGCTKEMPFFIFMVNQTEP